MAVYNSPQSARVATSGGGDPSWETFAIGDAAGSGNGLYTTSPATPTVSSGAWTVECKGATDGIADTLSDCRIWFFSTGNTLNADYHSLNAMLDAITPSSGELIAGVGWCNGQDPNDANFRSQGVVRKLNVGGTSTTGQQAITFNNNTFSWTGNLANIDDRILYLSWWNPNNPGSAFGTVRGLYNSLGTESAQSDNTNRSGDPSDTLFWYIAFGAATAADASGTVTPKVLGIIP